MNYSLGYKIATLSYCTLYQWNLKEFLRLGGFLNENTNELIRRNFPKSRDVATTTLKEINQAINKPNNRPIKCLGIKIPDQVF